MERKPLITRFSNMIIRSPLIWGGLACLAFYALLGKNSLNNPFVARYFEGHPIEYVTTTLFFVGLAALVFKLVQIMLQTATVQSPLLEKPPKGGHRSEEAEKLLVQLEAAPAALQESYLIRRLRLALDYIRRKGSADSLDDQIKHLADEDYSRKAMSYSFVNVIIGLIPLLGFLGTVVGITIAISKLDPESLNDPSKMQLVISGLSVAFDTTALSLSLSMFLIFVKFFISRVEDNLLERVDMRINEELLGRFQEFGSSTDPNIAAIRRASDAIVASTEELVLRQTQIWNESLEAANSRWTSLTGAASEVIESALAEAVATSLQHHAKAMSEGVEKNTSELATAIGVHMAAIASSTRDHAKALSDSSAQHTQVLEKCLVATADAILEGQEALADEHRQNMEDIQRAIRESAETAINQQKAMTQQGEILLKVVEATGDVVELQDILNENLERLAKVGNFEETVTSLAAAIQLLSSRLGQPTVRKTPSVHLQSQEEQPPAAA